MLTFNHLSLLEGPVPNFLGLVDDFVSMPVDLSKNGGLHKYIYLDKNAIKLKLTQITVFVSGFGNHFPRSEVEAMSLNQ